MGELLTAKQKELWEIIKDFIKQNKVPPTYEQLRDALKVKSLATVAARLKMLVRKGFIQVMPGVARGIKLLKTSEDQVLIRKPLLGTSAAGPPVLAEENIEKEIEFDADAVNSIPDFFLKVKGDSMIGAGINDGNLIAVKQNVQPNNGDIVVYMVDNESTIKRFYQGKDCIILKATNDNYPNISCFCPLRCSYLN